MNELAQVDIVQAAIELAEPHERIDIDDKLSVLKLIAKKIGADLKIQNKIAIARINNLRKLGDQLDEARTLGLIVSGSHNNTLSSILGIEEGSCRKLIQYADELNDWPEEEYKKWKKQFPLPQEKQP